MGKFWQWFLAHGDKLLTAAATVALSPGIVTALPGWVPVVLSALGAFHVVALPEPTSPPPVK